MRSCIKCSLCSPGLCLYPLMDLDLEEMWVISNNQEELTLEDPDNPWKVKSVLKYKIIRTMLRIWAEIRGLRIMGQVTETIEVTLGFSVNRTLNYQYTVRTPGTRPQMLRFHGC